MKKVGFIGGYDKTDLMIYVAKVLTELSKKVLIIDATVTQKARYVVPAINPTLKYVTEYEEVDIAVGFSSLEDIKKYLGIAKDEELEYDFIFIDIDNPKAVKDFEIEQIKKSYFVTSFDNYSIKRGLEALRGLENNITLEKVYFAKEVLKEDDDYINFVSLGYSVLFTEERIYFPIENGDLSVIYENQRFNKVRFRKLSIQYKDGLAYLAEDIAGNISSANVRRAIKTIEKGG